MLTGQNKINLILDHVGIKAPTFAKHVGVKYQRILDIQNGKVKNISAEVASRIIDAYPQFNIEWLLTGEGEMLKNGIAHEPDNGTTIGSGRVIPYYDAEVAAGTEYGMEMMQTAPVGVDRNRRPAQRQRICDACLRQQHGSELSCRMRDRTAPI